MVNGINKKKNKGKNNKHNIFGHKPNAYLSDEFIEAINEVSGQAKASKTPINHREANVRALFSPGTKHLG